MDNAIGPNGYLMILLDPTATKYAILLWKAKGVQGIFVEGDLNKIPSPPSVRNFPPTALPTGLIIGVAGLVYFAKGREN